MFSPIWHTGNPFLMPQKTTRYLAKTSSHLI